MAQNNMDLSGYIGELVIAGGGVVSSLVAWKQGVKTAKSSHLDNVEHAIKIWEGTSTKLENSLANMEIDMKQFKQNHEDCEKSKKELEDQVHILTRDMCDMKEAMHNMIGTPKDVRK